MPKFSNDTDEVGAPRINNLNLVARQLRVFGPSFKIRFQHYTSLDEMVQVIGSSYIIHPREDVTLRSAKEQMHLPHML